VPLITFVPFILVSIVFGYFVATQLAKADRANVYQKGLHEGEEERAALKEKVQTVGRERDLERQATLNLRAEVEALKNATPPSAGMDEATLQALKTAFEEKTAELLQAEQTASEGFRIRATDQISDLEARLAQAEADRAEAQAAQAKAQEEAELARQTAQAEASALATLDQLSEPAGISEEEVAQRIAAAIEQLRATHNEAAQAQQQQLLSSSDELAAARIELQALREQLESASGQVKHGEETQVSSNEAIAAVNIELLRLQTALQEAQAELAQAQQGREAAEAQQTATLTQAETESARNAELQARIAELEASLAQASATENSLQADSQLSRDEIGEWRRLYEEAEAKNSELEAATQRSISEAVEQALGEQVPLAVQAAIQETMQTAVPAAVQGSVQSAVESAVQAAVQETKEFAALELAEALAARDHAHAEALQLATQSAAAQVATAPASASNEELVAMRDLVTRMEARLGEVAQGQNGQLTSLTQELAGLRQIASLSRAVCEGTLRQATHTEQLRAQFEAAARIFLDGHTAFASDVLAPARRLQAALDTPTAPAATASTEGIGALQQAIEAPSTVSPAVVETAEAVASA
jgi:hypothetical protein